MTYGMRVSPPAPVPSSERLAFSKLCISLVHVSNGKRDEDHHEWCINAAGKYLHNGEWVDFGISSQRGVYLGDSILELKWERQGRTAELQDLKIQLAQEAARLLSKMDASSCITSWFQEYIRTV